MLWFYRKESLKKCTTFEEQKGTRYIWGNVYFGKHYLWRVKRYKVYSGKRLFWHYYLPLSFVHKTVSQISLNLFWLGDKRLLLKDKMNVSPNVLAQKVSRHCFVGKMTMIRMALTSSCYWKNLVLSCLEKKIVQNAFLPLTVNYCKIPQKNKLFHSKQHQIGYLMIYDVI